MVETNLEIGDIITNQKLKKAGIKIDEKLNKFILYSNFAYLLPLLALIGYLVFICINYTDLKLNYINEILYIIICLILVLLTFLNSMYYHHCGGLLLEKKDKENFCKKYNIGYELELSKFNDLVLALSSLIAILLLIPKYSSKYSLRFFLFIISNLIIITLISFTELNMLYATIVPFLVGLVVLIICIKNIINTNSKKKYLIILLFLGCLVACSAVYCFKVGSDNIGEIKKNDIFKKDHTTIEHVIAYLDTDNKSTVQLDKINTNITALNKNIKDYLKYHSIWHILGALAGFILIIYKIYNVKISNSSKKINIFKLF